MGRFDFSPFWSVITEVVYFVGREKRKFLFG